MTVSEIQLYQILKNKLGDKVAEELVSFVRSEMKTEFDNRKEVYAMKDDIFAVKSDIAAVREDMLNMKSDLLRSIYVVGLVQFLAIAGSVLGILNFMLK